jgi:hypothetical protein
MNEWFESNNILHNASPTNAAKVKPLQSTNTLDLLWLAIC